MLVGRSSAPSALPSTLGELRASRWRSVPVKEEIRRNVLVRVSEGIPVVSGVLGYSDSVLPALEHALIAGHDVIFLGERGQAKSRMIRSLVGLLDEWLPVVAGSEINDDPYRPVSRMARDLVAEAGDETPVAWVHRSDRYGEKLATPDTSMADLIGEVDPIKVAEGRYLSDELTLHYGLVPRTNRGIFAINELPDLAERIQVGLLDVLEERDVQIRGHKVRLPLDILLVASANPEDYTNRGRIITPLKDRFGARIRTHYPQDLETELTIVAQEARSFEVPAVRLHFPWYMSEIVARVSQLARRNPKVSQHSGVSVRLSVTNQETLAAAAIRRALRHGEAEAAPRVSDLGALQSSTLGKLEIESLQEGEDEEVVDKLIKAAILQAFREHCPPETLGQVAGGFEDGTVVHIGPDLPSQAYVGVLAQVPALRAPVRVLTAESETPAEIASAIELVLDGLHLSKRLNKDTAGPRATYRAR
jgi:magnesium chelatase subunit I